MRRLPVAVILLATAFSILQAAENGGRKPLLSGDVRFFVEPEGNASRQAKKWRKSRPADAALMDELAKAPSCIWLCEWNVEAAVNWRLIDVRRQKALPVFVLYNIPERDAGQFAKGGEKSFGDYLKWIARFINAVGKQPSVVILEPDALGLMQRYPKEKQAERYKLLASVVALLSATGTKDVYIDAGNAAWLPPAEMAKRLRKAGIEKARGFALNVSNFQRTDKSLTYGREVSELVGGKHFVIDTSRNGNGPLPKELDRDNMGWCNPPGRAIGTLPTTKTGEPLCDAFLWVKDPGASDGTHRGGPAAGRWWPEYALELMRNAKKK